MTEKIDKDEINLLELISIIWSERKLLFISFFSVFFLSFFLTFLITPKYESSAILLERSSNSSEISSGASSLARIAGFQLPETNEMSKSALAIELLESFDFFYENLFNDSEFLNNITFDDLNIDPKKAHQFFKDNFKVEENSKSDVLVFSFSSYSPASSRNILDLVISKLTD